MAINRRDVLLGAARLTPGLIAGAAAMKVEAETPSASAGPTRKLKIIVTGGHPGDPEYGCGGTVARLTALGHEVVLLYLNDGGWPPNPPTTRIAETTKASEILKARPAYAGQINGHAIVDNDHYEAYQKIFDAEKPDAVFNQWPIDNHRDHRATSMLTYDVWKESGRNFALYYYEVSDGEDTLQFAPTHFVDITETESLKRAACYAHASQTPDRYYELQDSVARFRGIQSGYKRAEAFIHQIQSPCDIFPMADIPTR
jgi:LmbE family N-acetylglucosaminyl deacetylase